MWMRDNEEVHMKHTGRRMVDRRHMTIVGSWCNVVAGRELSDVDTGGTGLRTGGDSTDTARRRDYRGSAGSANACISGMSRT